MLKKTITYTDYNGEKRTEDFYFNLNKAELAKMDLYTPGGFEAYVRQMVNATDVPELTKLIDKIVLMAYGERSVDGKHFRKDHGKLAEEFEETEAYSELYIELMSDTNKMIEFINGIVPADVRDAADSPEVQKKLNEFKTEHEVITAPAVASEPEKEN